MQKAGVHYNGTARDIVLYDGVCGLCQRSVRFILRRDQKQWFRFAPLDSDVARAALGKGEHGDMQVGDSMLVLTGQGNVLQRSAAVFYILKHLGWPWRALRLLRWLPREITDGAYGLLSRHRYRLFGRFDACPLPPDGWEDRFL